MKTSKIFFALFSLSLLTLFSFQFKKANHNNIEDNKNLVVLVQYKTQPNKSEEAISVLTILLEEVKKEPNFVSIRMHVDPKDATNILLYEEWSDAAYYNGDHMNTQHLQNFMVASRSFLAGPPAITQWEVVKDF